MKILLANWVYDWGSTGYITRDLTDELTKMGHQVVVATAQYQGKDDSRVQIFTTPTEWKLRWWLHRMGTAKFSGSKRASKRLIRQIETEKPDVVNLHLLHSNCLNFYYLLRHLGQKGIKVVVTNHAELYYTGNCGHAYECTRWVSKECQGCGDAKNATGSHFFGNPHRNWILMQKAFTSFRVENLRFTAVSPWVKERFLLSPIVKGFDCDVVMNGLNVQTFYPRKDVKTIVERIGTSEFLLHVTANFNPADKDDVKGAFYLVQLAKAMPKQTIVVVATSIRESVPLPNNILIWGKAKNQDELAKLYSAAKITVLLSRRETFSMVTAESLCCGTPVVGFKAGGPESIAIPEASKFVEQKDVKGLAEAIRMMSSKNNDRIAISEEARGKYSPTTMARGYLNVYEKLLKL